MPSQVSPSATSFYPPHVYQATLADVAEMADLHVRAFPGFFLSALGVAFLRELYRGVIADPTGIAFKYARSQTALGLVVGTIAPDGFYTRILRRRWPFFAYSAIGPACRNPAIIPRLVRRLRKPIGERSSVSSALLMSLAVDPETRRMGAGAELVRTFCKACALRGSTHVRLTTDLKDNDGVNAFYANQGFRIVRSITTAEGRHMNEYLLDLPLEWQRDQSNTAA